MYADSTISLNTTCPVRKARVDPNRDPVYVNGSPVAFCCHPCPSVFSKEPERYLREMKVSLRCPVRPAHRAIFDSSLRMRVNQDVFFFSSLSAMKLFQKDPLRYCGVLTDPVTRGRFRPTKSSPHVTFRGRDYWFAAESTLVRFQAQPERFYERLAGT
jgi:YHS domain-containing protein